MEAYRLLDWERPPELVEVPVPDAGPGQVLVEVAGCGLCHSDLTMVAMPGAIGEALGWEVPFTLGHEVAGRVAAVGAGIGGVAEGDPVLLAAPSCGTCAHCRAGRESACPERRRGPGLRARRRPGPLHLRRRRPQPGPAGRPRSPPRRAPHRRRGHLHARGAAGPARARPRLHGRGHRGGRPRVVRGADPPGHHRGAGRRRRGRPGQAGAGPRPRRPRRGRRHRRAPPPRAADLRGRGPGGRRRGRRHRGHRRHHRRLARQPPPGWHPRPGRRRGRGFRRPWFGGLPREATITAIERSTPADARAVVALAAEGRVQVDVQEYPLARVAEAYAALDAGTLTGRAVVVP